MCPIIPAPIILCSVFFIKIFLGIFVSSFHRFQLWNMLEAQLCFRFLIQCPSATVWFWNSKLLSFSCYHSRAARCYMYLSTSYCGFLHEKHPNGGDCRQSLRGYCKFDEIQRKTVHLITNLNKDAHKNFVSCFIAQQKQQYEIPTTKVHLIDFDLHLEFNAKINPSNHIFIMNSLRAISLYVEHIDLHSSNA